jgi:hypothetical protein
VELAREVAAAHGGLVVGISEVRVGLLPPPVGSTQPDALAYRVASVDWFFGAAVSLQKRLAVDGPNQELWETAGEWRHIEDGLESLLLNWSVVRG